MVRIPSPGAGQTYVGFQFKTTTPEGVENTVQCTGCKKKGRMECLVCEGTRKLPVILRAASDAGPAPTDDELRADAATFGVTPLFDGEELERI